MSDFSVEQKLELVQQVRSQYYRNQSDLMNREEILYGKAQVRKPTEAYSPPVPPTLDHTAEASSEDDTRKLRFGLTAVLVLLIILFDKSNTSITGVSMEQVFDVIAYDYEEVIDTWVDTLEKPSHE